MKVLITGGGTREPIDGVRFITNFSTGATAAGIAEAFARAGAEVVYLAGQGATPTARELAIERQEYGSFADLDQGLQSRLKATKFDAVIHLAAVSDYSIAAIENGGHAFGPGQVGKLDSGQDLVLRLKPNFKIVDRIKEYAGGKLPLLVAFKLTKTPAEPERLAAIQKLGRNPGIDFIVHNDLGDRERGAPLFRLFARPFAGGPAREQYRSREELAQGLISLVSHHASKGSSS